MIWAMLDFNQYTLSNLVLFSSKAKLERSVHINYGDLLEDTIFIDWKNGEVFAKKEDKEEGSDPVAVFRKIEMR